MNEQQRAGFEAWASKQGRYGSADCPVDYRRGVTRDAEKVWQAALASPEVQALRDALKVANDALEEISNEMTFFGDRWTNAGQSLLDALPVTRAAITQEES